MEEEIKNPTKVKRNIRNQWNADQKHREVPSAGRRAAVWKAVCWRSCGPPGFLIRCWRACKLMQRLWKGFGNLPIHLTTHRNCVPEIPLLGLNLRKWARLYEEPWKEIEAVFKNNNRKSKTNRNPHQTSTDRVRETPAVEAISAVFTHTAPNSVAIAP